MAQGGRYSRVIRGLEEALHALVAQCDRALGEQEAEIIRLRAALTIIAGGADQIQAIQAIAALDNLGTEVHTLELNPSIPAAVGKAQQP